MKTTLHYSARMTLYIHSLSTIATIDLGCTSLSDAFDYVDCIFNNATMFRCEWVDSVHVINSDTGELIAECEPDGPIPVNDDTDLDFEEEGFDPYNPDWEFNEDEGFNPYEGCYDYDC